VQSFVVQVAMSAGCVPDQVDADTSKKGKPCRTGQTGNGVFGTLGARIDVAEYDKQFRAKVDVVFGAVSGVLSDAVRLSAEVFASPPAGHRHRATFIVRPGTGGLCMDWAMWDQASQAHSMICTDEVPIFSQPIVLAMELLQRQPIVLDRVLATDEAVIADGEPVADTQGGDSDDEHWGCILGCGMRSVQFHSTLSGELLVCFVYHDERLRRLRRHEHLPDADEDQERWLRAAATLRERFLEAAPLVSRARFRY